MSLERMVAHKAETKEGKSIPIPLTRQQWARCQDAGAGLGKVGGDIPPTSIRALRRAAYLYEAIRVHVPRFLEGGHCNHSQELQRK